MTDDLGLGFIQILTGHGAGNQCAHSIDATWASHSRSCESCKSVACRAKPYDPIGDKTEWVVMSISYRVCSCMILCKFFISVVSRTCVIDFFAIHSIVSYSLMQLYTIENIYIYTYVVAEQTCFVLPDQIQALIFFPVSTWDDTNWLSELNVKKENNMKSWR